MNRLHKVLEEAAEEIENCYGKEMELSNELREFIETADDLWEFAQSMPEYERLKERDRAKKPDLEGDGYDPEGNMVYDTWICPNCETHYEVDYDNYEFCPKCGQRIDRTELEKQT